MYSTPTTEIYTLSLHDALPIFQQAGRQAEDYNESYNIEIERLTVHGILHLLGYTDKGKDEKEVMWARQEGYL
mgnify:CR=1 FL=1